MIVPTPSLTNDTSLVSDVLAEAFAADPLFGWVFSDAETRADCLQYWWSYLASQALELEGGELWTIGSGSAAAMWYPPVFEPPDDASGESEESGAAFVAMLGGLVGDRLDEVLDGFRQILEAHPQEPHWYLPAVGTRVAAQGRGLGAHLLRPVLDRCDEQGLGAYLESSSVRNVPFYHRLGFEITGEILLGDDPVVVTKMWRPSRG